MKTHQTENGRYWSQIYLGMEGDKRKYKRVYGDSYEELEINVLTEKLKIKKAVLTSNMTLREGMQSYIELKKDVLEESTITSYKAILRYAYQDIMDLKLKDIDTNILEEATYRESKRITPKGRRLSPKTLKNEYTIIRKVLTKYSPTVYRDKIELPKIPRSYPPLLSPDAIYAAVKGSDIELAVLLGMWLSMSLSEIRGLTKSKSLDGDYITIREVVVRTGGRDVRKILAKEVTRNRRFLMPEKIKGLVDAVDGDIIVPLSYAAIYHHWTRALKKAGLPHISFHETRHVCASIMAMLSIPTKTACEYGGWSTPDVMQNVYTQVFDFDRKEADKKINAYFNTIMEKTDATKAI